MFHYDTVIAFTDYFPSRHSGRGCGRKSVQSGQAGRIDTVSSAFTWIGSPCIRVFKPPPLSQDRRRPRAYPSGLHAAYRILPESQKPGTANPSG